MADCGGTGCGPDFFGKNLEFLFYFWPGESMVIVSPGMIFLCIYVLSALSNFH